MFLNFYHLFSDLFFRNNSSKFLSKRHLLLGSLLVLLSVILPQIISPQKASAAGCGPTQTFKTVWKTDNAGTSNSTSITIPTTGGGYSYTVDVNNDGDFVDVVGGFNEATLRAGNTTIDFGIAGTYPIAICGDFPRIMFNNTGDKLKILDITQWGDNPWTSMVYAFYGASNLTGTFTDTANTSGVTQTSYAFFDASNFNGDVTGWDMSNVTQMGSMFWGASSFNQPIGVWDVSSAINMSTMFSSATSFNQPLNSWDVSNLENTGQMFFEATSFNQPLDSWDMSNIISTNGMFFGATSFNQPLDSWDMSNIVYINGMFTNASSFNQPLDSWEFPLALDLGQIFYGATSFNRDISSWDTSNVTGMFQMFWGATSFNQPLNTWDVSNVTDMTGMFEGATSFNQPLSAWNTGSATDLSEMFRKATLFNQNISGWDVSNVTDLQMMFQGATSFNQPIGSWDTSSATNVSDMFSGLLSDDSNCIEDDGYDGIAMDHYTEDCTLTYAPMTFNQNISGWDVSNVTDMSRMFAQGATEYHYAETYDNVSGDYEWSETYEFDPSVEPNHFNQDISTWNVSNVTDMTDMFLSGAYEQMSGEDVNGDPVESFTMGTDFRRSPFSYALDSWDMSSVTAAPNMLTGTSLSISEYDSTLTGWSAQTMQNSVVFGALGLAFCEADADRQSLIDDFSWVIDDDGQDCPSAQPVAPILKSENVSNVTQDTTPVFQFSCVGVDHIIDIYVDNSLEQQYTCAVAGNIDIEIDSPQVLGVHTVSYTTTNTHGGVSPESGDTSYTISAVSSSNQNGQLERTGDNIVRKIIIGIVLVIVPGLLFLTTKKYKIYKIY